MEWAIFKNNIEMVRLLIDYANRNDITLDNNQKKKNKIIEIGNYPLIEAMDKNINLEMVKLLMDYSKKKKKGKT